MDKKTMIILITSYTFNYISINNSYFIYRGFKKPLSLLKEIYLQQKIVSANETYGNVKVLGPFGNTSSNVKIAYVVGLHPQENASHQAFLDTFKNIKDLKYCYYIYQINVTENIGDYEQGRMNG